MSLCALIDAIRKLPIGREFAPLCRLEEEVAARWNLTEKQVDHLKKSFAIVELFRREPRLNKIAQGLHITESAFYQRLEALTESLTGIMPALVTGDAELENTIHTFFFEKDDDAVGKSADGTLLKPAIGEAFLSRARIESKLQPLLGTEEAPYKHIDKAIASLVAGGYIKLSGHSKRLYEAANNIYGGRQFRTWEERKARAKFFSKILHYMEKDDGFQRTMRLTAEGFIELVKFISSADRQQEYDVLKPYTKGLTFDEKKNEVQPPTAQYAYFFGLWPKEGDGNHGPFKLAFSDKLFDWEDQDVNLGGCALLINDRHVASFREAFSIKQQGTEMKKLLRVIDHIETIGSGPQREYVLSFGHGPTERRIRPEKSNDTALGKTSLLALTLACLSLLLTGTTAIRPDVTSNGSDTPLKSSGDTLHTPASDRHQISRISLPKPPPGAKGYNIS